jgi:hypothetical protein
MIAFMVACCIAAVLVHWAVLALVLNTENTDLNLPPCCFVAWNVLHNLCAIVVKTVAALLCITSPFCKRRAVSLQVLRAATDINLQLLKKDLELLNKDMQFYVLVCLVAIPILSMGLPAVLPYLVKTMP